MTVTSNASLCFSIIVSKFQALNLDILDWFYTRLKKRALCSVFYMWISSFPSTVCWSGSLFSSYVFWHRCQQSNGCGFSGLFLDILFYSIGLLVYFFASIMQFLLLWLYSIILSQHWLGLHWLFGVFWDSLWILQLVFLFLKKWPWNFSMNSNEIELGSGSTDIFKILILLIHEHKNSFCLLEYSSIFFKVL
jgi:hypothetical protein